MTYENDVKRLDEILKKISDNTTSLDDAIKLFEEGKKICDNIETALKEVEAKITEIRNS